MTSAELDYVHDEYKKLVDGIHEGYAKLMDEQLDKWYADTEIYQKRAALWFLIAAVSILANVLFLFHTWRW
jgi:hypothetical protein